MNSFKRKMNGITKTLLTLNLIVKLGNKKQKNKNNNNTTHNNNKKN